MQARGSAIASRKNGSRLYTILMSVTPYSEWSLYANRSYISPAIVQQERIMSDLIYIGLGVFLFVVVSAYARACGRL